MDTSSRSSSAAAAAVEDRVSKAGTPMTPTEAMDVADALCASLRELTDSLTARHREAHGAQQAAHANAHDRLSTACAQQATHTNAHGRLSSLDGLRPASDAYKCARQPLESRWPARSCAGDAHEYARSPLDALRAAGDA